MRMRTMRFWGSMVDIRMRIQVIEAGQFFQSCALLCDADSFPAAPSRHVSPPPIPFFAECERTVFECEVDPEHLDHALDL
jgi:hypothetical protein